MAAVVAALLVGGLLATGIAERAQLADRRSTLQLLASMTAPEDVPRQGVLGVRVVVVNAGPEPVTVTEARLDGSLAELLLAESVTVPAGASRSVPATLREDCVSRTAGRLVLVATTADGRTNEVLPAPLGRGVGMAPGEVSRFCGSEQTPEPIPVWRTIVDNDGSLFLQLRNTGRQPVSLTAESPPGTTIVADPALPATLPTGRSTVVRLYVQVDRCTSAAQRADAGNQVELLVDGEPGAVQLDRLTLVGWFAQQVARDCP